MYTTEVSFLAHNPERPGLANVAGLAQQFGFSLPGSSGERPPEFYQNLLRSRQILEGVVGTDVEVVTPAGVTLVDLAEHFEIEGWFGEHEDAYTASYYPGARLSDPHCVVMETNDYYEIGRMLHFVL